eukprot:XP_011517714.1 BEN domain-containing protein 7 isoform X21 [Homo sapiens]
MEIKKQITGMRRLLNDSTGRIYQRVGKEGEKLKEEPQDLDLVWPPRLNSSAEAPQSLHPSSRGVWNELPPQSGQFSGQYGTRSRTFQSQPHPTTSSNGMVVNKHSEGSHGGELPVVNSSAGSNCCTCNCQSTLQAILQELKTMRKLMQIQAVGTQNRQQPPISLICSQRTAVSRKRNKKKKVPPKTVEPLTVKQKPSGSEMEKKSVVASELSALQAAEHTSPEESRVLGFGIVLESPSSDKYNLLKALTCLCLNLSWTLYCQTTLAQEAFCLENWCVRFLMTRLWLTPYPMGRGKEDSMTTGKD